MVRSGNAHLNFEGGSISTADLLVLTGYQLFQDKFGFFFHFQNNLVLTGEGKEFSHTDTYPFRVNVRVPCIADIGVVLVVWLGRLVHSQH